MDPFTWILIAVISFAAVALLAPKPEIENAKAQSLGDIDFPQADEGFPVTKLYGRTKLSGPNTMWYGDFEARPITQRVKSGLFSHKDQITGYQYFLGLQLGLCLGPNITLHKIIVDSNDLWVGDLSTESSIYIDAPTFFDDGSTLPPSSVVDINDSAGLLNALLASVESIANANSNGMAGYIDFYPGNFDQSYSAYLDNKIGEEVPAYIGVSHLVLEHFYIGNSASLRQMAFEASCYTNSLGLDVAVQKIGYDINGMEAIYDALITNFGGMFANSSIIDTDSFVTCAITLAAEGNGISVAVDGSKDFKSFAIEILRQSDAILFQHPATGLITARLIRNDYDLADLRILNEEDIVTMTNISKGMWSETFNQIRMIYKSRLRDYEDTTGYAEDMANISFQGRPKSFEVNFPMLREDALAQTLAFRELAKSSVPLLTASVLTNRAGADFLPGDPFIMGYSKYNLAPTIMRVQKIGTGTSGDNRVKLSIFQDIYSVDSSLYSGAVNDGSTGSNPPVEILIADIFELPAFITNQQEEVLLTDAFSSTGKEMIVAFAYPPNSTTYSYTINYNYALSEGDPDQLSDYVRDLSGGTAYPVEGNLTTAILETDGFVDGTMVVYLHLNNGSLATQTLTIARTGENLIFIENELMMFTTVTNLGSGNYSLLVHRAVLDTQPDSHSIDTRVWFITGINQMVLDSFDPGVFSEVKPLGIFGGSKKLPIADQDLFGLEIVSRRTLPMVPDYLRIDSTRTLDLPLDAGETYSLAWRIRDISPDTIKIMTDGSGDGRSGDTFEIDITSDFDSVVRGTDTAAFDDTSISFLVPSDIPAGPAKLRIRSVRSGVYSRASEVYPVIVSNDLLLSGDENISGVETELLSGDGSGSLQVS